MFSEEIEYEKMMLKALVEFCENNRYEIVTIDMYGETAVLVDYDTSCKRTVEFDMGVESWM